MSEIILQNYFTNVWKCSAESLITLQSNNAAEYCKQFCRALKRILHNFGNEIILQISVIILQIFINQFFRYSLYKFLKYFCSGSEIVLHTSYYRLTVGSSAVFLSCSSSVFVIGKFFYFFYLIFQISTYLYNVMNFINQSTIRKFST